MGNILIPSLVSMGLMGLLLALGLVYASKKFAVKVDPKVEEICALLPGVNCGACGMAGCSNYAEAVASGEVPPNCCTVGGAETAEKISKILGVTLSCSFEPQIAHVFCGGCTGKAEEAAEYEGISDCRAAHALGGTKVCTFGCLGFGTCVQACPFDALTMGEGGLPIVDDLLCTGCGKCVEACPRHVISLVPKSAEIFVDCNSNASGAATRKACKVGCIACGRCVKVCEFDAISIKDFLASVDHDKCTSCKKCVEVCPVKCIDIREIPSCAEPKAYVS